MPEDEKPGFDWEAALDGVDLEPTYEDGSPDKIRVMTNIMDEDAKLSRELLELDQQFDELIQAVPDDQLVQLRLTNGEGMYKSPELLAAEEIHKKRLEISQRKRELIEEQMRLDPEEKDSNDNLL